MKKKPIIIGLLLVCVGILAQAQDSPIGIYDDALRYSRTSFGGTARIQAIGGAQVSLGGDQSLATSNPAGLGFFNRSTVVFTPALNFHTSESAFLGENNSAYRTKFNIGQLGVVLHTKVPGTSARGYRGGSFAISLNRVNNFNDEVEYLGFNDNNSIIDSFIENADGIKNPDDLRGYEEVAFDHFLIDEADFNLDDYDVNTSENTITPPGNIDLEDGIYTSPFGAYSLTPSFPRQAETIKTRGGQNQINLAWGGNYSDRLYFGAGVGIETINFNRERTYVEDAFAVSTDNGVIDDFLINSISITDNFRARGTGVNVTIGVIGRPLNFVTIGISFVSPTLYSMNEESFFTFITDWNSDFSYILPDETTALGVITTESDINKSRYTLKTPARLNFGSAFFFGKRGFITADIEYIDYGNAKIRASEFREQPDNDVIADIYQSSVNYRLGGEFRLSEFRFRGGFAWMADPFKNSEFDRSVTDITFGLGYRTRNYFIDLAVVNRRGSDRISPYFLDDEQLTQPIASVDNVHTSGVVTFGFTF